MKFLYQRCQYHSSSRSQHFTTVIVLFPPHTEAGDNRGRTKATRCLPEATARQAAGFKKTGA